MTAAASTGALLPISGAFGLLAFEDHPCSGTGHHEVKATWVVYVTVGAVVATAYVCDSCRIDLGAGPA